MAKVSLLLNDVTVEEAINMIEKETSYSFLFTDKAVDIDRKVSIRVNNGEITDILAQLLKGTDIGYQIIDRQIILAKKSITSPSLQQDGERTVTGTVVDASNEPVIGANIREKGTTNGTVTDIDGKFSLNVPGNSVLQVSYIGYDTQEIEIGSQRQLQITLIESMLAIDEVVVIGYGVVRKSDVTGSIVSVNSEEMMKRNPVTIGEGLQGVAAGVSVYRNSGDPTGEVTVRIRGIATVNNSADPLYVVDGIQVGTSISFLNPNDVESIEVLKDASATAIYGSKGANGVVMVTTKKGLKGHTQLNFTANYSAHTNSRKLDVLDAEGFVKAARRAAVSDGNQLTNVAWINYDRELNSIDWQEEMIRTALRQNYNLSVSGGNENTQSVFSVGYMNNDGILINSNFKRLTGRANIDHKVKEFLRTGVNVSFTYSENHGNSGRNMISYATLIPTMDDVDANGNLINVPVRWEDGTWGHFKQEGTGDTNKSTDNPVAAAQMAQNHYGSSRILTNAYMEVDILKDLVFKFIGGFNYANNYNNNYQAVNARTYVDMGNPDQFSVSENHNLTLSLESFLTYNLNIDDVHRINLMAGYSASSYKGQEVNAGSRDFPVPTIRRIDMTKDKATITGGGGLLRELRGLSVFGRINYSLRDKYLLTATIRRDGSSNFGVGNRYGTFPSASLAWRTSEEAFIRNLNLFSNLKVRLGWGQTGNAGNSTNLSVNQLSSATVAYYHFINGQTVIAPGLAQTQEIDTNLKWETNEQTNVGVDFGFLNNSVTFSVDYFVRDAKNLLLYRSIRPSTGYSSIYTNAGQIRNSGFEFLGAYQNRSGDWSYNIKLNASTLRNKVIDVGEPIVSSAGPATNDNWNEWSLTQNGYPIASFYAWRVDGVFQTQEEIDALNAKVPAGVNSGYYQTASTRPGDYKYRDLNGDNYIDDKDREIIGHGFPKLNYGLNAGLSYKNWDLNLYFYGVAGQKILSYAYKNLTTMMIADTGYRNILKDAAGRAWTPENHSNYPRLTKTDANHNVQVSDAYLQNGDFLRLQNLQIGYTFPVERLRPLRLEGLRLYASIENIYTFTGYGAGDPEIGGNLTDNNGVLQTGFDAGRYPFPRSFAFGLSIGF
jgi:TonB-linked SusC/RagA family outer membrane protein